VVSSSDIARLHVGFRLEQRVDHRADDGLRPAGAVARQSLGEARRISAALQRDRQDHRGIARNRLNGSAALAGIDEGFAEPPIRVVA
jgi:hypothetical protein